MPSQPGLADFQLAFARDVRVISFTVRAGADAAKQRVKENPVDRFRSNRDRAGLRI